MASNADDNVWFPLNIDNNGLPQLVPASAKSHQWDQYFSGKILRIINREPQCRPFFIIIREGLRKIEFSITSEERSYGIHFLFILYMGSKKCFNGKKFFYH